MSQKKTALPITDLQIKKSKGAEILYITRSNKTKMPAIEIDLSNCVLFERKKQSNSIKEIYIKHPYKSILFTMRYGGGKFLDIAQKVWTDDALERIHPTATVIVSENKIIGKAGNGLTYHTVEFCERKKLNIPTGQGYHLCNGNHLPENHSEPKAVRDAGKNNNNSLLKGATAYLYGHWWSCEGCSQAMEKAGIKTLVISKTWTRTFLEI